MKNTILLLPFYFLINSAFCQNDFYSFVTTEDNVTTSTKRISSSNDYLPDDFIGTPYSDEIFQLGTVFENNTSKIKDLFFRYNVYKDNIEIKKKIE